VLTKTGIRPDSLVLEITESMIMENAEIVFPLLQRLKEMQVKLHIDDFGTGYSSLSYLHQFPVDVLKIDRSFVQRMEVGADNYEIVKAITTLAESLGMEVVAEGVETDQQLVRLRELNCQYLQGYLFSRPLSTEDIEALLSKRHFDLLTHFTRTSFES
jgi:EAL domain-containing protein (putative c-di-GMP-specific phosphodiesterase class I)